MPQTEKSKNCVRILLIEDDADLCSMLQEILSTNYSLTIAQDGEVGKVLLNQIVPDILILDLNLPKANGIDICKGVRSNMSTKNIPILVISGINTLEARLEAFQSGADDFIEKPFHIKEFCARLESKVRRLLMEHPAVMECGNLIINTDNFSVLVNNRLIPFTQLEFNILKYFICNKEKIVSRQRIAAEIWQEPINNDRTVDTHLVAIRKKLNDFDHEISTIYGAGYLLRKKESAA